MGRDDVGRYWHERMSRFIVFLPLSLFFRYPRTGWENPGVKVVSLSFKGRVSHNRGRPRITPGVVVGMLWRTLNLRFCRLSSFLRLLKTWKRLAILKDGSRHCLWISQRGPREGKTRGHGWRSKFRRNVSPVLYDLLFLFFFIWVVLKPVGNLRLEGVRWKMISESLRSLSTPRRTRKTGVKY